MNYLIPAAVFFISSLVFFLLAKRALKNIIFTAANFEVHAQKERQIVHALVVNAVTAALKVTK
jgi:hypothetical protein